MTYLEQAGDGLHSHRLCILTPVSATQIKPGKTLPDCQSCDKRQSLSISKFFCSIHADHQCQVSAWLVLERGTYLAGLNCELCPASAETPAFSRHSSTKGGLSPTTAGSPVPTTSGNVWQCLHSAVAFFQSSKFYPKWDAIILMKWTLPQDTMLAGICLPRAVTPGQPFPHRREAPFHHFWCGVCPEHQHAPSSRETNLFWSYHPSIYSASKQQWWLNSCRLLIVMILAPPRFSAQPSSLKSVSGH